MDASTEQDEVADIIVLGSGAAGLSGAIFAALNGLKVLLLEKTELIGGTTSLSGGATWIPLNDHAAEVGVTDTVEEASAYLNACAGPYAEPAIVETILYRGTEAIRVLRKAGVRFRPWPSEGSAMDYRSDQPGAKHGGRSLDPGRFEKAQLGEWASRLRLGPQSAWLMDRLDYVAKRLHVAPPNPAGPRKLLKPGESVGNYLGAGSALTGQLLKACLALGVDIRTQTQGKRLIVESGRVTGVEADEHGTGRRFRARCGVLVATGGYSHNDELKRLWMDRTIEFACEIAANQGDGHRMGMSVGAQVAGLGDAWWFMLGAPHINRYVPHTLIVNRQGKRFCDESVNYYDFIEAFGSRRSGLKNLPAWLIFDQQGVDKYAVLHDLVHLPPRSDWAPAGAGAVSPPMPLTRANSLEELASKVGIDAQGLAQTVERFNEFARSGVDLDFGRGQLPWSVKWGDPNQKPNPSLGEVGVAPFYAIEIRIGALATRGGLHVSAQGQVRAAADGLPIPGLYAAGNCSSGAIPYVYPGFGGTIGAAITFAFVAMRHAAGEPAARQAAGDNSTGR